MFLPFIDRSKGKILMLNLLRFSRRLHLGERGCLAHNASRDRGHTTTVLSEVGEAVRMTVPILVHDFLEKWIGRLLC